MLLNLKLILCMISFTHVSHFSPWNMSKHLEFSFCSGHSLCYKFVSNPYYNDDAALLVAVTAAAAAATPPSSPTNPFYVNEEEEEDDDSSFYDAEAEGIYSEIEEALPP